MTHACSLCGLPVDPRDPQTHRRIQGWERKSQGASRKSGSDIVLREQLPEFACFSCIFRLQQGISVGQESLL